MAHQPILALALYFCATAHVQAFYGGGFPGQVPRHPMMGGGVNPMLEEHPEPKYLTCLVRFRNPQAPGNVLNAIAVNIEEKRPETPSQQGGWQAMGGFMSPMLGGLSSMYAGGVAGRRQGAAQGPGLEATVQLFSTSGGPVSIAVTDAARPEESCNAEDFGYFLRHPNSQRGAIGGGFPGMGGYPGMKYGMAGMGAMKYGMGAMKYGGMMTNPMMAKKMMMKMGPVNPLMMGAFGGHPGMGQIMGYAPGFMGSMDDMDDDFKPEGVIAETDLNAGMKATINIDRLEGFTRLEDLAGRGVVVCPDSFVDRHDDDAMCEGGILACCALHYDENKQMLP